MAGEVSTLRMIWQWVCNLWFIGRNARQVLENQAEILKQLRELKAPKDELEKMQYQVNIYKAGFEGELKVLQQKGAKQNEQDMAKIKTLQKDIIQLEAYKGKIDSALRQAHTMIGKMQFENDTLKAEVARMLDDMTPEDLAKLL